jgi:hypothetical protein
MNIIIESTLKSLQKSQIILNHLSNSEFGNTSVPPYHSSIGSHIRHILDFYACIFSANTNNSIDLTNRSRNKEIEIDCRCAEDYLNSIIEHLNKAAFNMDETVIVIDDLGLGMIEIPYTYGAVLAQANSHTIHHYAIINYILDSLGVVIRDSKFGYNPTTPNKATLY